MKDRKTLNKILTAIIILCTSVVLMYASGVAILSGGNIWWLEDSVDWAVGGPVLCFAILALGATIVKMVLVTVPTFKAGINKPLAITALVMDIIVLVGFVFIVLALGGANLDWGEGSGAAIRKTETILTLILIGVPFMFVGGILSGRLQKAALKPAK